MLVVRGPGLVDGLVHFLGALGLLGTIRLGTLVGIAQHRFAVGLLQITGPGHVVVEDPLGVQEVGHALHGHHVLLVFGPDRTNHVGVGVDLSGDDLGVRGGGGSDRSVGGLVLDRDVEGILETHRLRQHLGRIVGRLVLLKHALGLEELGHLRDASLRGRQMVSGGLIHVLQGPKRLGGCGGAAIGLHRGR